MQSGFHFDEAEFCKGLSPKACEFVHTRIQQELESIQKDQDRLIRSMNDEILHMKQRILYDMCSKMQSIANLNQENIEIYKEKCPDLFTRFSQKSTKKRMRKKPKLQKLNISPSTLTNHLDLTDILTDLSCVPKKETKVHTCNDSFSCMTTKNGQKWLVEVVPMDNGMKKLKYCDGSSSVITKADIETLHLQFDPVTNQ